MISVVYLFFSPIPATVSSPLHTFPVSLLSRFLVARSLRAHRARLHGPTFVNNISRSRLFAAAPAISAPTLLLTWGPPSTSLGSTVSTREGLSFVASAHACWTSLVSRGPASAEEIPMRENTWPGVNLFKWDPGSSPETRKSQRSVHVRV